MLRYASIFQTTLLADNPHLGTVFIFITAASPNRAAFGATNGLSQVFIACSLNKSFADCFSKVTVSLMRGIGPSVANSLFSLSIEKGYLGGNLVYYVLLLLGMISIYIGSLLPKRLLLDKGQL